MKDFMVLLVVLLKCITLFTLFLLLLCGVFRHYIGVFLQEGKLGVLKKLIANRNGKNVHMTLASHESLAQFLRVQQEIALFSACQIAISEGLSSCQTLLLERQISTILVGDRIHITYIHNRNIYRLLMDLTYYFWNCGFINFQSITSVFCGVSCKLVPFPEMVALQQTGEMKGFITLYQEGVVYRAQRRRQKQIVLGDAVYTKKGEICRIRSFFLYMSENKVKKYAVATFMDAMSSFTSSDASFSFQQVGEKEICDVRYFNVTHIKNMVVLYPITQNRFSVLHLNTPNLYHQ